MGPWWSYVLAALAPTIASVAALIVAMRTHTAVNSRMSVALKAATKVGRLSERAVQKKKREQDRQRERRKRKR